MAAETNIEIPARIRDSLVRCDDGSFVASVTAPRYLKDILNMEVRPSDVMVVTWPKSGTTWMQYIVWQLLYGNEIPENKHLFEIDLFLESPQDPSKLQDSEGIYKIAEELPSPRLMKTHLKLSMLPTCLLDSKGKVIYVMRNPKDAAVSYFHFCRAMSVLPAFEDWSEFFEYFCKGLLPYGDWFDHVLPWWEKRNEPNVLFIKYEDMKKDSINAIKLVAEFLGKSTSEEEIKDISSRSSFEAMKNNPATNPDTTSHTRREEIPFMRKGKVGDWKNHFTVAQNERFNELCSQRLEGSGLELDLV